MTDSDIRTLKTYLRDCLEPRHRMAEEYAAKYKRDERDSKTALDADIARQMGRYFSGQATALQHAIDDFKELFEEELKEGE